MTLNRYVKRDYTYCEDFIQFTVRPGNDAGFMNAYLVDITEGGSYFNAIYRGVDGQKSVDGLYVGTTIIRDREISYVIVLELEPQPTQREIMNIDYMEQGDPISANIWYGIKQVLSSIDYFCANNDRIDLLDDGARLHESARNDPRGSGFFPAYSNHHVVGLLVTGEFLDRQNLLGTYAIRYVSANGQEYYKECPIIFLEDRNPIFDYSFHELILELADYAPILLI